MLTTIRPAVLAVGGGYSPEGTSILPYAILQFNYARIRHTGIAATATNSATSHQAV